MNSRIVIFSAAFLIVFSCKKKVIDDPGTPDLPTPVDTSYNAGVTFYNFADCSCTQWVVNGGIHIYTGENNSRYVGHLEKAVPNISQFYTSDFPCNKTYEDRKNKVFLYYDIRLEKNDSIKFHAVNDSREWDFMVYMEKNKCIHQEIK